MTLDLDELERVAKRAGRRNWTDTDRQDFDDAFTPAVCAALIARARDAERLEAALHRIRSLVTARAAMELPKSTLVVVETVALSALNEGGPANG